jgi:hypothetical protein
MHRLNSGHKINKFINVHMTVKVTILYYIINHKGKAVYNANKEVNDLP